MGVIFNDPDLELSDIYWYVVLAGEIDNPKYANLVTVDEKLDTRSCYVELHRFGEWLLKLFILEVNQCIDLFKR